MIVSKCKYCNRINFRLTYYGHTPRETCDCKELAQNQIIWPRNLEKNPWK